MEFVSLDSLIPLVPAAARVVAKIDVEGTEHDVLRHGQSFLGSYRPDVICEVLEGVAHHEELERLLPSGYSYYLIGEASISPRRRIQPSARFRDWLFTGRSPDELASLGIPVAGRQGQ